MKKIFFSFLPVLVSVFSGAQVPQQFNYQGVARNAGGQPMTNQNIKLRLSIRDSIPGGTVLYGETRSLNTNQFGIFTVAVNGTGATNVTGNFTNINWSSANKFLQVEIDPSGGSSFADLGSTQLLSVPFALHAGNGFTVPYTVTKSLPANAILSLTNSDASNPEGSIKAASASTAANATAIQGVILSAAPGNSSAAIRGINNGTGPDGIGVWGSQNGGGRGVYGTSNTGAGIFGQATGGIGVHGLSSTGNSGQFVNTNAANTAATLLTSSNGAGPALNSINSGTGNSALLQISNTASTADVLELSTNGTGRGLAVRMTNNVNVARAVEITQNGTGHGLYSSSSGGIGVQGITGSPLATAAGIFGQASGAGIGVYGISSTGNSGQFVNTNAANAATTLLTTNNGSGATLNSINNGTGRAGLLQISNTANTSDVLELSTNGTGGGLAVQLTNTANGNRGVEILQNGIGPGLFSTSTGGNAVWGITSSISAAGVIGDNTFGEAVVGRNRGGSGVGAIVGRNDSAGYGVRGFSTKTGIGVLGQSGISGSTGKAARFENVNASNTTNVFEISSNSTANLAVFIKSGANVARINSAGRGFFDGGTQASGADIAEAFEVIGEISNYEPGDVLVISRDKDRTVCKSGEPYSDFVAGVYATKPGMLLTEEHIDANIDKMAPMGVMGVIPTKVCLEGGAIKRGDLLVTSSIAGVAMKGDRKKIQYGQVLGKALQEFDASSIGKISVLVNIQ